MPAALIATASTGFVGATLASRTRDRVGDLLGGSADRRGEEHMSASTRGSASTAGSALRVRRGRRAAEHVDGVLDARLRRQHRRQRRDGLVCEARQLEPGGLRRRRRTGCRARPRS